MTQEEKKLLLEDLCSRLPYGVKIHIPHPKFNNPDEHTQTLTDIQGTMQSNWITFGTDYEGINVNWNIGNKGEDVPKPYLRSMSSMTKEEKQEFYDICTTLATDKNHFIMEGFIDSNYMLKKFNWLNEHHFNYRLPDNLFIEAPKEIYND